MKAAVAVAFCYRNLVTPDASGEQAELEPHLLIFNNSALLSWLMDFIEFFMHFSIATRTPAFINNSGGTASDWSDLRRYRLVIRCVIGLKTQMVFFPLQFLLTESR
jgi:hypothetical protein